MFENVSVKHPDIIFLSIVADCDEETKEYWGKNAPYIFGTHNHTPVIHEDELFTEDRMESLIEELRAHQANPRQTIDEQTRPETQGYTVMFFTEKNGGEHIKRMESMIDVAATQNVNIQFCKIDVNENPIMAMKYGVKNLPTIAMLKNGKLVRIQTGTPTVELLNEILSKFQADQFE